ncbi:MAG: GWxTD domain-containing protein, partial [Candidatus Aminicenantes bacterium]
MNKLLVLCLSAFFLLAASTAGPASQKPLSPKDLEPKYRLWMEEEVVFIITQKERDVFLQLRSNRERDIFIDAFWKQRDPTPNTP